MSFESPLKSNRIVALDNLIPHPDNYRQHPDEQVQKLVLSLQRFGQGRSIVIQDSPGKQLIVAGHGIVDAAKALKWPELRADILPADWTPEQVKGYLIADNQHAQGASDDDEILARLLQEQQDLGIDLASLGTDDETLRQMLESLGDEYLQGESEQEEDYSEDEEDLAAPDSIYSDDTIVAEAFKHFRNTGFPYRDVPIHVCMEEINRLANTEDERLLNTRAAYHVADTYHPHRFHASAENMKSPVEAFEDDKTFRRALTLQREFNRAIGYDMIGKLLIVSGTQACSNFRPGFALFLYRQYCKPGSVVLDSSTGYGGRLIGFIASGFAGKYIGIDPNTETYNANIRIASDLHFSEKVELYNLPAEDVPHEKLVNRCDFAFTSPPYFAKEHYSDEDTQSWKRYSTGDAWREGFLQKMLVLQFVALKPGSTAIVNIADVKLRNKTYPLVKWTIEDGKAAGFTYLETKEFPLTRRFGAGQDDEVATEPVIVFRKPQEGSHA